VLNSVVKISMMFAKYFEYSPLYLVAVFSWTRCRSSGCTLAQHGEYDWTVHVRQRCGLMSNYFDHLESKNVCFLSTDEDIDLQYRQNIL